MAEYICPTCQTVICPTERCTSERGMFRCVESQGHEGWHWAQVARDELLIWTGLYSRRSCPERLSLSIWCVRDPGHDGPHTDGHGRSWVPEAVPTGDQP